MIEGNKKIIAEGNNVYCYWGGNYDWVLILMNRNLKWGKISFNDFGDVWDMFICFYFFYFKMWSLIFFFLYLGWV